MSAAGSFRWARKRRGWAGRATVVAVALLVVPPPAAAAQSVETQLPERELVYRSARSEYQAALDAWTVVEKRWNDAVEDHARARRAGDDPRTEAALVRALDLAHELDRLERRVSEQRARLDEARTALVGALDTSIDRLAEGLGAARTTADRGRLTALLRDRENQLAQMEAEGEGRTLRLELVFYPSIQFDPRDTPETLGFKAQLLRSKAEQADSTMGQIDREIERIERQLQRSRNVSSLVSGVERFGDAQVPVGVPNRRPVQDDVRARPDSAGVSRPEATPEQQLQELRLLRLQVREAKRQFLDRAATFERLGRRVG